MHRSGQPSSAPNLPSVAFYPSKGCAGIVTPQPLRAVWVLFSPMVSGMGRRAAGKVCPACISETVRCRKLILVGTLVRGCRCAMSWCDLDLTFDLAVVTLSLKILSGLYLGNRKV